MINIRRMGCNGTHGADFSINRPRGYDCYLLLMVKTLAKFYIDGNELFTEPDTLIIYSPGTPHLYEAFGECYINDWMQFDADENFIKGMKLPMNRLVPIHSDSSLYKLFQLISESFYAGQENDELITFYLSHALLYSISNMVQLSQGYRTKELTGLRCDIYSNPAFDWSVPNISKKLNVSQGYVQYLYKAAFGVSCQKDVERSRMECACRLLASTAMSVKQISYECGYRSSEHFMRCFKKDIGRTPSQYRNSAAVSE